MIARAPIEYFPALQAVTFCRHAFIERIPGIDVSHDKAEALKRLDAVHREMRDQIGMAEWPLLTAQQIHGDNIAIVDHKTPAIGLVHSGKKGTERAIVSNAIQQMREHFGSDPAELVVQLSPCIRPPHYEIDFAAQIVEQCRAAGVKMIHDSGVCTACDVDRYYSYRAEKGKTGRMLALLGLT